MFQIGDVSIKNKVALAPMAGISNPAFIKICEEMNVGYAITELISAEAIVRNNKKTFEMLNGYEKINIPVALQLFGSNPDTMASAAKIINDMHLFKIIDINMGCPVPKVALRSEAGSSLLKNEKKACEIVQKVVASVDVPVTVKMRSGWDSNHINCIELSKKLESAGASAIAIHPRTRTQGYTGKADWNIIKEMKENLNIPVIGNGDIKSCHDAKKMLDETKCDAVMIGRSALGNPWIIKECVDYLENKIEPNNITPNDKFDMILKHLNNLKEIKNEKTALLEIRTHAAWYLKGIPNTNNLKKEIFKTKSIEEFKNVINSFRKENGYES